MMLIDINIGDRSQSVEIADNVLLDVLQENVVEHVRTGVDAVEYSLDNPIGTARLEDIVKPHEKIVIITSDITRPVPSHQIIPSILKRLRKAGVAYSDIKIVFALGSHRFQTEEEKKKLVGNEVYGQVECIDGDNSDLVHMGKTALGTPIDICRSVAEADRRICIANIEYHYFAGYSGGAKAIMPGVSTREAIQSNHSMMTHAKACAGNVDNNPVRDDLEDAIKYCNIDFICNVVLDAHKNIVDSVAGHYIEAHRAGCKILDKMYSKPIEEKADIVIVSQGGKPKDLNMYQTQKALDNAKYAVKDGGIIILVGSCAEGMGESVFEEWMLSAEKPSDLIERIENDFQLGGHKAAAIALVMAKAEIFLVSDMPVDLVKEIFMQPFSDVQTAYNAAKAKLGENATVIVMPFGGSTLPVVR
jgi:nickel-dependent lactate racemase